ncbi:unnamed protein product, partial [Vitis vinifera]|uniref:Uncharacterized protein n=1 Tax=Vitis vinifera TaxID=29760 RepID=D7TA53_VITVI
MALLQVSLNGQDLRFFISKVERFNQCSLDWRTNRIKESPNWKRRRL